MVVIGKLLGGKHSLVKLVINQEGDRILGINSRGYLTIWRYDFSSVNIVPSLVLKGLDVVDAAFTSNGSTLAILTKEMILSYDLLKFDISKPSIVENCKLASINGAASIEYIKIYQCLLVLAPKRDKVFLYELQSGQELNRLKVSDTEITSYCLNDLGSILVLGYSDGMVRTYSTKTLSVENEFDYFRRDGGRPIFIFPYFRQKKHKIGHSLDDLQGLLDSCEQLRFGQHNY